jgi:two-component system, NarL family, sensor histidine kinase UhpB
MDDNARMEGPSAWDATQPRVPGGAYRCRGDGPWTIEWMDPEAARVLGLAEPAAGRSLRRVVAPLDRTAAEAQLASLRADDHPYRVTYRVVAREAPARLVLDEGHWVRRGKDQWLRCGFLSDISACVDDSSTVLEAEQGLHNLAGYLQSARESERSLIARELHDDLGSSLTLLASSCSALRARLPDADPAVRAELDELRIRIAEASDIMRRVVSQLRPPLLDALGLPMAVEAYVERFSERTGIDCRVKMKVSERGPRDTAVETVVFRVLQEALTNAARHARAHIIYIVLQRAAGEWQLEVRDDGQGFAPERIHHPDSFGLQGMRERVRYFRGSCEIDTGLDAGTTVRVRVPGPGRSGNRSLHGPHPAG